MLASLKLLLILVALSESRILAGMTNFEKELTFEEKEIILGKPFITENESFLYAICVPLLKTFGEKHCNVTIETPAAFANATYKDTCSINFTADKPKLEVLSKLEMYGFGDDKVLLSWLIRDRDYRPITSRVRILNISTCDSIDLAIPHEDIMYLLPYKTSFDVMFSNDTFCKAASCRQTYSHVGKKLVDSSPILKDYKYKYQQAIMPRLTDNSFYAIFAIEADEPFPVDRVFRIMSDGKGTEVSSYPTNVGHASFTEAYNSFGVCTVSGNTKVNCRQYDAKVNIKMNANVEFKDEALGTRDCVRWLQAHSLQEGGMLIVSGTASGPDANRFDEFSVIKLHEDGTKERPLVIDSLNFVCSRFESLKVAVSENNNVDELCFHFICKRQVFDQNSIRSNLKFATKCMPRVYLTMAKRRSSVVSY